MGNKYRILFYFHCHKSDPETPPHTDVVGISVSVVTGTFHSYSAPGYTRVLGSFEVPADSPPLFSAFRAALLCLPPFRALQIISSLSPTFFFSKKGQWPQHLFFFSPFLFYPENIPEAWKKRQRGEGESRQISTWGAPAYWRSRSHPRTAFPRHANELSPEYVLGGWNGGRGALGWGDHSRRLPGESTSKNSWREDQRARKTTTAPSRTLPSLGKEDGLA